MKRLTLIGVIAGLFIVAAGIIYFQDKMINRLNGKVERLTNNIGTLLEDSATQSHLSLTQKELTGKYKRQRDSLAALLNIRPKEIYKFIDRVITQVDTVIKQVPVYKRSDTTYYINDRDKCFIWQGTATIRDKMMYVERSRFEYLNNVTDVFYWQRKFPVIGKKRYYQNTVQDCGDSRFTEINIVKRKE